MSFAYDCRCFDHPVEPLKARRVIERPRPLLTLKTSFFAQNERKEILPFGVVRCSGGRIQSALSE